jgi:type IV pilus assembly protein PilB
VDTITDVSKPTLSGVARVLVHGGKLAAARAEELVRSAKEKKVSFISELMGSGELSPAQLAHALSSALAVPLLDLDAVDVQRLPKNIIDAKLIGQYHVLPLNKRGSRLFLACADPTDQEASERIKFATQLSPEWVVVEHDKLSKLLEDKPGRPTRPWRPSVRQTSISTSRKKTRRERPPADVVSEVEDAPVVRFLQKMLVDAINMRASDLHFEPYEYHYRVRFRVDGELREITQPPLAIKDKLASRIKVISRLDISEKRVPQDGRMKLRFGSKSIDFRVSTLPTLFGEKIVIRILDSSSAKLGIEALGYEPAEKERLLHAITAPTAWCW